MKNLFSLLIMFSAFIQLSSLPSSSGAYKPSSSSSSSGSKVSWANTSSTGTYKGGGYSESKYKSAGTGTFKDSQYQSKRDGYENFKKNGATGTSGENSNTHSPSGSRSGTQRDSSRPWSTGSTGSTSGSGGSSAIGVASSSDDSADDNTSATNVDPGPSQDDFDNVKVEARNQARLTGGRFVLLSLFKKFMASFNAGIQNVRAHFEATGITNSSEYLRGQKEALNRGESEGKSEGILKAQYNAMAVAHDAVRDVFAAAIDSGHPPQLDSIKPPPVPSVTDLETARRKTMGDLINDSSATYTSILWNTLDKFIRDPEIVRHLVSNSDLHFDNKDSADQYEALRLRLSNNGASGAFRTWLNTDFGISDAESVEKYSNLRYPELQKAFQSKFEDVFSSIKQQYGSEESGILANMKQRAFSLGEEVAREAAHQRGIYDGYKGAYTTAFTTAYTESFGPGFKKGRADAIDEFSNSVFVGSINAQVVPGDQTGFIPYSPISVKVSRAENLGGKSDQVPVSVSGDSVYTLGSPIYLQRLSSNSKQVQTANWAAKVLPTAEPNKINIVTISIYNRTLQAQYIVQWTDVIRALIQSPTGSKAQVMLENYVQQYLAKEQKERLENKTSNYGFENDEQSLFASFIRAFIKEVINKQVSQISYEQSKSLAKEARKISMNVYGSLAPSFYWMNYWAGHSKQFYSVDGWLQALDKDVESKNPTKKK